MEPRIYNLIAELCARVNRFRADDAIFVRYSCISLSAQQQLRREIYQNVSELFVPPKDFSETGNTLLVRQLRQDDLTESFFDALERFAGTLREPSQAFMIIALLQVLDEGLETILRNLIVQFQSDDFSLVLNINRETTGIGLLPCCSCMWERRHRLSYSYNRLDNYLFSLLLIDNAVLGERIDKHYFLKQDIFPHLTERRELRIAASPLSIHRPFVIQRYEEEQVKYFRLAYDNRSFAAENECIWQKITEAARQQADIVVFPEVMGNPQMIESICQKLSSLPQEQQACMPSLIILPSVWEKNRNTVTILDKTGHIICSQSKQNPYRMEEGEQSCLEAIHPNQVVNIFHHEGIGRMAILICRDFLTTHYMEEIMRCFHLTLMIVPSFSTGSYDFRRSFDLCAHDDCNVVWINSCAAFETGKEANFEHIGYVRKRIGRYDDHSQTLCRMPSCGGFFSGQCSRSCLFVETIKGV